ncbi:beta-ketoacyl synthase [Sorangium cellulosum]|uniref:Beta-ketoacyl synthase n=1 Tax=Sorangium cellulosum TaxID=56 RepID=A0A2L0EKU1_SORCE|nr:AMP-binding protein [Sorangium cellulosum]AUX39888.1 beta-ketoacyl synthase [Sorangium cellulosum]
MVNNHLDIAAGDPPRGPSTVGEVLLRRASLDPHGRAYLYLIDGEREGAQLTYSALDQRARAIGARLHREVGPGGRALLLYPSGLDFIEGFLGCLYAGVIAVPAYPPEPGRVNRTLPRLKAILNDARPAAILTTHELEQAMAQPLSEARELDGVRWFATDRMESAPPEAWTPPVLSPDALAFLQYTSGSTSAPKGVMVSHGGLLHTLADMDVDFGHGPDSVMVTWLPTFHDMGLIYGLLLPLFIGFPCVLMSPSSFLGRPVRWLKALSRYGGTHTAAPNFAFTLCTKKVSEQERAQLDLSRLKVALNAAEPIRRATVERFTELFAPCGLRPEAMCAGYGLAEFTLKVTTQRRDELPTFARLDAAALESHRVVDAKEGGPVGRHVAGCGRPALDTRIEIVHPETLRRCGPNEVGEIWLAGTSCAQGYWNLPEASAATFQAFLADSGEGPFLRTGDLGFLRDGELFITGRDKDLIIIRGRNHYPQDIEQTAEGAHPALRSGCSAAFSVEVDEREYVAVVAEVYAEAPIEDADAVAQAIRNAVIEQHEVPVHAVALLKARSIPKTSSGKIQRRACRLGFQQGELDEIARAVFAAAPPAGDRSGTTPGAAAGEVGTRAAITRWLVARLVSRLGMAETLADLRQPFSHYGVDSADAIDLAADLGEWLGRELPANVLYAHPTIEDLINFLAGPGDSELSTGTTVAGGQDTHQRSDQEIV